MNTRLISTLTLVVDGGAKHMVSSNTLSSLACSCWMEFYVWKWGTKCAEAFSCGSLATRNLGVLRVASLTNISLGRFKRPGLK